MLWMGLSGCGEQGYSSCDAQASLLEALFAAECRLQAWASVLGLAGLECRLSIREVQT